MAEETGNSEVAKLQTPTEKQGFRKRVASVVDRFRGKRPAPEVEKTHLPAGVILAGSIEFTPDKRFIPSATPEKELEIKRFSDEQKETLEGLGFKIYTLTGQSLNSLEKSGRKMTNWLAEDVNNVRTRKSMRSEVAINPSDPFIAEYAERDQIKEKTKEFEKKVTEKVPGSKVIFWGEAPDYAELAFAHRDETGGDLFGAKGKNDHVLTNTQTAILGWAHVGGFSEDGVLKLKDGYYDHSVGKNLYVAPLVVPA